MSSSIFVENYGFTKTNTNQGSNEVEWKSNYDGNKANIEITTNDNGFSEKFSTELTNDDLMEILGVQSINMPLEERLKNDFFKPIKYITNKIQEESNKKKSSSSSTRKKTSFFSSAKNPKTSKPKSSLRTSKRNSSLRSRSLSSPKRILSSQKLNSLWSNPSSESPYESFTPLKPTYSISQSRYD
jgi:hypothetical protein